jgi:UDP-4-amino-4,6-dideoxy-N-acetyl-beta-L-altrosamine N-acetyltransferase
LLTLNYNGITLKSITQEDIEQVRLWRNAPEIAGNMEYTSYINEQQQLAWFEQLKLKTNCHFFIINVLDKRIGLAHLSEINLIEKSAQVGLFIGELNFVGTGVALAASTCLLHFAFDKLALDVLYAKVKNENKIAINYNAFLGFEIDQKINDYFNQYKITAQTYHEHKDRITQLAQIALLV